MPWIFNLLNLHKSAYIISALMVKMILCSVFALLSLHMFMYGCNLYMWRSTRINYNFIFEFSPSTALKHRDAFLISASLMTTVVGAMVLHLLLRAAGFSPGQIDALPGILLLVRLTSIVAFPYFWKPTSLVSLKTRKKVIYNVIVMSGI